MFRQSFGGNGGGGVFSIEIRSVRWAHSLYSWCIFGGYLLTRCRSVGCVVNRAGKRRVETRAITTGSGRVRVRGRSDGLFTSFLYGTLGNGLESCCLLCHLCFACRVVAISQRGLSTGDLKKYLWCPGATVRVYSNCEYNNEN